MKTFATFYVLLLLATAAPAPAQTVVNAYARVTAQSGAALTLSNLSGTFAAGDEALLIQVQDDVIGANTANTASFGNLGSIQSAGLYERVVLTAATPTSVALAATPATAFNYSANTRVQLVSFPDLGSGGNFTTTAALGALAWNGNVGGVLAFRVGGTLTLAHNLVADGRGFRGGVPNPTNFYAACDAATYVDNGSTYPWYGRKGEGIYNDNGAYPVGRGHLLNGGGGGNDTNAGGGGGGNFTAGGLAGPGWNGSAGGCSGSAGGGGGAGLAAAIGASRVLMGGGGGGGQQNDNVATSGGPGGGLIFVRAAVLQTLAGCGGAIAISANGAAAVNAGNDGAGGGGAGGTIVLQITTYALAGACPLNLSASGASGGNVNTNSTHGGGGGGGKGAIVLANAATTPNNMSVTINVGQGGANYTAGPGADPGAPSVTTPLFLSAGRPLPVVLTMFAATAEGGTTRLSWTTASERNSAWFEVERAGSSTPTAFERIGRVAGAGTSGKPQAYAFGDALAPANTAYYRLRQLDADGAATYSPVRAVRRETAAAAAGFALAPNPAQGSVSLDRSALPAGPAQAVVADLSGRALLRQALPESDQHPRLDLQKLAPGLYMVRVEIAGRMWVQRLVKE